MKCYDKYKHSSIEWLGNIPEHWELKKIKHWCYVKGRVGWNGLKASEFLVKGFSYLVTGTDFKDGLVDWENCYQIDEDRYNEDPFIQLKNEDLLITKDGTIGKVAIVEKLAKPACLNSGIFVVRSLLKIFSTRYLYWILLSDVFKSYNEYTSYGSTIQHLYQNVFVEFNFCFPTIEEQTAIANFLDKKTAQIDKLITNKQKLIELLKEERTAIINQAVTRGINPNVKLKPSGIEWLGEIPEHWEVKKLKFVARRIGDGIHATPEYTDYQDFFFVNGTNLNDGKIEFEDNTRSVNEEEFNKYNLGLKIGAVLLSLNGTIGKSAIYQGEKIILGKSVAYIDCNEKLLHTYLFYLLKSEYIEYYFENSLSGTTIRNLSLFTLRNTKMILPDFNEQKEIVIYIETETRKIDNTISKIQKEIELLQEYRTALISEVVTGKVKVIL